jgi:energy-coupling factor transport system permease protein
MFHPAAQILTWLLLVITLQLLHPVPLLICGLLLLVAACAHSAAKKLHTLMRRTRWILFSLLLIYACATPGEPLYAPLGAFSPTLEGVQGGLLQLGRLLCALAALSLLLTRLDTQQLISGLYTLAWPLRFFGLSRERIAVRLALTLHYAEAALQDTANDWRASVERMMTPPAADAQREIEIPIQSITPRDGLLLAAGCVTLALAWL